MLCSHHCIPMFQWNMLPPSPGPFLNKVCVSPVPIFSTTPIFFFSVFHLSPVTSCGSYKAAFYPHISLCCFFGLNWVPSPCHLLWTFLQPVYLYIYTLLHWWSWRQHIPPKHWYTSIRLHGVTMLELHNLQEIYICTLLDWKRQMGTIFILRLLWPILATSSWCS